MAIADFSLPAWLNQDNTTLIPDALARGASAGASIANAMQGAAQVKQAQQRLQLIEAENQRQEKEFAEKARMEAMRYQGFQNFARDRQILKSQPGVTEEQANYQAFMNNAHLVMAGDPRGLSGVVDRSADNTRQADFLGVQRSRLAEAEYAARQREQLTAENLELKRQGLDEQVRRHDESLKAASERQATGIRASSDLESKRQEGRKDLVEAKNTEKTPVEEERKAIEDEIATLKIDLAKNPKQKMLDFGKDNRQIKLEELEKQKAALDSVEPPKSTSEEMVSVIAPDGSPWKVPRSNLGKALKRGYKEAP